MWKIKVKIIQVLQNRAQLVFVHALSWGRPTAEPLKKVHENGYFAMNKLIIKVEVKIVQAFDERDVSGREMVDSNGFQVLCTQVVSINSLYIKPLVFILITIISPAVFILDNYYLSCVHILDTDRFVWKKLKTSGKHLDLVTSVLPELALIKVC
ncbi:hypothetical protein F2Q68_00041020 [Brassica cretica]|uniref:Uncharacterized protein n=1 Tax=Brassica cretica TaxID=69181 RepID=A0A8S9MQM8_BRACR|nr:hypothetical protein F2Q68_00041020 [Brassica cretica]